LTTNRRGLSAIADSLTKRSEKKTPAAMLASVQMVPGIVFIFPQDRVSPPPRKGKGDGGVTQG
jgi:hypothetical protein